MGKKRVLTHNQDCKQAKSKFNFLKESYANRKVYEVYLDRIDSYIIEPPSEDWDGVFTHTTK